MFLPLSLAGAARSEAPPPAPLPRDALEVGGGGQLPAGWRLAGDDATGAKPSAAAKQSSQREAEESDSDGFACPPMPLPQSLVGRHVAFRRKLHGTALQGVISDALPPDVLHERWRWRVRFSGGMEEDMDWPELQPHLIGPAAEAAPVAASAPLPMPAPAPAAAMPVPAPAASMHVPAPAASVHVPAPAAAAPQRAGLGQGLPKGVHHALLDPSKFRIETRVGGRRITQSGFDTAEEAAHAWDNARRKQGLCVVNFPRAGTNEVQAVRYEADRETLGRIKTGADHTAADARCMRQHAARCMETRARGVQKPARMELRARTPAALAAAAAAPAASVDKLVGRRVRLAFQQEDDAIEWFCGVVQPKKGERYHVLFDDGERWAVKEKDVKDHLISDGGGAGAAADAPAQRKQSAKSGGRSGDAAAGAAGGAGAHLVYRGVWRSTAPGKFRAVLNVPNNRTNLGDFDTAKSAAMAVDQAARKAGLLYLLNFPETEAEKRAVNDRPRGGRPAAGKPAVVARKRIRSSREDAPADAAAGASPPKCKRVAKATAYDSEDDEAGGAASGPFVPQPAAGVHVAPVELPTSAPSAAAADDAPAVAPAAPAAPAPAPVVQPAPAPPAAAASALPDPVAAFLSSIKPPLQDLDVILAAQRAARLTMAHLMFLTKYPIESRAFERFRDDFFKKLEVKDFGDQQAFTEALMTLPAA